MGLFKAHLLKEEKMDLLNYGDKVTCLNKLTIKGKKYSPGDDLPYERAGIDFYLIQKLCNQHRVMLSSEVSPERLKNLKRPKVNKIIQNYNGERVAVSWPDDEPLPDGVIMLEPVRPPVARKEQEQLSIEKEVEVEEAEVEEVEEEEVEIALEELKGGYYNVLVDGSPINDKKLRKKEAKQLMEDYIND
jgi:hypothetical protein